MNQEQYRELQFRYNALVDKYQELDKYCREHIKEPECLPKENLNDDSKKADIFELMKDICQRINEEDLVLESVSGDKKSAKISQYIYKVEKEQWVRVLAESMAKYNVIYLQDKQEKEVEKILLTFGLLEGGVKGIYFKTTRFSKAIQVVKIKKETYELLLEM